MTRYKLLTFETVGEMKQLIWDGHSQAEVANRFFITQPHVSRIVNGHQWPEVAWPDRSLGALPMERKSQLNQISHSKQLIGRPLIGQVSHASPAKEKFREEYAAAEKIVLQEAEDKRVAERTETEKDMLERVRKQDIADRKKKKKTKAKKTVPLDWAVVSKTAAHIGIVAQALADEDIRLQNAICRAYATLPPSHWDDSVTLDTIEQIMTQET